MREITHFIGGQAVAGASGRFSDVFNPNTGRVQARAPLASAAEVDACVANALAAQAVYRPDLFDAATGNAATDFPDDPIGLKFGPAFRSDDLEAYVAALARKAK